MKIDKILVSSGFAGFLIGLAAGTYLTLDNKILGAFLFSMGLYFIIENKLLLFTGKCGFNEPVKFLIWVYIGNILGILTAAALFYMATNGNVAIEANALVEARIGGLKAFASSILCGVMIFMAVRVKTPLAVIFAVMIFVLCGFEHCIADVFYLAFVPSSLKMWSICLMAIAGNVIGAKLSRVCLDHGAK